MNNPKTLIKELCNEVSIPFESIVKKNEIGVVGYCFLLNDNYLVNLLFKENNLVIKGEVVNIYVESDFYQDIALEALKLNISLGLVEGPWLVYEQKDSTLYIVNVLALENIDSTKLKNSVEILVNQQINIRELINKYKLDLKKQVNEKKLNNQNEGSKFYKIA